jgi:hypothetical protein
MTTGPVTIGRYQVRDRLGQGGMGVLYLALDPAIDRLVALKVLRVDNEEMRERFLREARLAARLQHPNIVTIYDVGSHDGQPFIAMEYISGETLAELIQRRAPLAVERKLELMLDACQGLAYAHRHGIVHRDIKPANLMVGRDAGVLKVLDFGIARGADSTLTQVGMLMGTPNYMSPEQVEGRTIDQRSDIFAIGLVFYELLAYRQAFRADTPHAVLHAVLHSTPTPLSSISPDLDRGIGPIVDRAIAKDFTARYQDLEHLRLDLLKVIQRIKSERDQPTMVTPAPGHVEQPHTPKRTPAPSADRARLAERRAAQIATYLDTAEQALTANELDAAMAAAESAALLDQEDVRVMRMFDRIRAATDAREVAQLLAVARQHFNQGLLTEAGQAVIQALQIDAGQREAQALKVQIERALEERERQRERERASKRAMQRVEECVQAGALEGALRAIAEAAGYDPQNVELQAARERVLALVDQRAHEEIAAARAEVARGQHDQALHRLMAFAPWHTSVDQEAKALQEQVAEINRQRAEEEAIRQRALDEQRQREAEEARLRAEEEARVQAIETARRKAEEDARRQAEEEARRQAAEEAARQKAEEDARRKAEEEARRKAAEEAARKAAEEARLRAEAEARKKAEEEAARKAEDERRRKAYEEARRKVEEEKRLRAEAAARKRAADDAAKKKAAAEAEAARQAADEARRRAEEEAKQRAAEEARQRAEAEARQRAAEEAQRQAEDEARRKTEEEARVAAAEDARRRAIVEEEARNRAAAEDAARKAEAAAVARQRAEEEGRKQTASAAAATEARRQAEAAAAAADARRKAEAAAAAADARRKADAAAAAADARRKAEAEADRQRAEEAARKQAAKRAEEEARQKAAADERARQTAARAAAIATAASSSVSDEKTMVVPALPRQARQTSPGTPVPPAAAAPVAARVSTPPPVPPPAPVVAVRPGVSVPQTADEQEAFRKRLYIGAAIAAVILLLVILITLIARRGSGDAALHPQDKPGVEANKDNDKPVEPVKPPVKPEGKSDGKTPGKTDGKTDEVKPETKPDVAENKPPAIDQAKLDETIEHSRHHLARHQRNDALKAISTGMSEFPQDKTLPVLMTDLVKMVQSDAERARTAALNAQAPQRAADDFKRADDAYRDAQGLKQNQAAEAARGFINTEELFVKATTAARRAPDPVPPNKGPQTPNPPPPNPLPPNPPPPTKQPEVKPDPPPVRTENQQPQLPPPVNEKAAIQQTLNRLAAAYGSLDANQVAAVWPTINAGQLNSLRQTFNSVSSYVVTHQNCTVNDQGTRATAQCEIVRRITYKVQGPQMFTANVTYRLEKRGGAWVIVEQKS